jgi:hypothetical protein
MRNRRIVDRESQQIDYHLNILGVRVWRDSCQLIARAEGKYYNAARLWLRGRCSNIATGYYLCFDGRWLPHSWGVTRAGVILDSHSGGRLYFGTVFADLRGLTFTESACPPPEVKAWIGTHRNLYQAMLVDASVELAETTRPQSRM